MGCNNSRVIEMSPKKKNRTKKNLSAFSRIFKRVKVAPRKSRTDSEIQISMQSGLSRSSSLGSVRSMESELFFPDFESSGFKTPLSQGSGVPVQTLAAPLTWHGNRGNPTTTLVILEEWYECHSYSASAGFGGGSATSQPPVICEQSMNINRVAMLYERRTYAEAEYSIIPGTIVTDEDED